MLNKKGHNNTLVPLTSKKIKNNGVSTVQTERELLSFLIAYNHESPSVLSLSEYTLTLLESYPPFHNATMSFWSSTALSLRIIASSHLTTTQQEGLSHKANQDPRVKVLDISYSSKGKNLRIDINLAQDNETSYYFSYWSKRSLEELRLLTPFLKDFFGIFILGLMNALKQKQTQLIKNILEKTVDSVEITNAEAVIQYVNPAFEKITLYKKAEALNKTVASLLRSSKEDEHLFAHIKKELQKGNTWRGQLNSKRKDGSDWIAQTVIFPVRDEESGEITQHIAIKQDITEQINQMNQLKVSEERYRKLMNAASDAIFIHDLNGLFVETNKVGCKSLGYLPEELKQLHVWDIEVGPTEQELKKLWSTLQEDTLVTAEGKHRRKDGSIFPVDVHLGMFNTSNGKLVVAIVRDVTEQKRSQVTIRQLTRALEQSPVLVFMTNKEGIIEYVNAKVLDQTGYHAEEILGQNPRILQSGHTSPEVYASMWDQLNRGQEWRGELLNKNKQGELFWVSAIISPLRDEEEAITHYIAVMEDISQKKSYEEMLKYQATYDNLTNLPNRYYGYSRLEQVLANANRKNNKIALLFLDLNGFKQINDTFGHAAGDAILKTLSDRYLSIIRQSDTVARVGGDEFMMILENLNHVADAEAIAKKCYEVCLQPCVIESKELLVSSSIGIAIFPEHGTDAKTLMHHADMAMYHSKMNHQLPWTIYDDSMEERRSSHTRIKTELYDALAKEELYLCYQPIMDVKNNQLVAAEALLRWHSSTLGQVQPDQFIPIAEETGLIIELGYWILRKVCQQIKEWQILIRKDLKIAVNISMVQLKQNDFVEQVKRITEEIGITPDSLIFEITESVFIDDTKFILSQLNQLNNMKIHCSLDDFGMRYSSLNSLRSYPFKSLKIDKTFIHGINNHDNDLSLVHSIITMSRTLKLDVVAEGIETEEQLRILRSLSCDMVQGWYFSEALSIDNFLSYLNNQSKS